jgi:hypothetical protein
MLRRLLFTWRVFFLPSLGPVWNVADYLGVSVCISSKRLDVLISSRKSSTKNFELNRSFY